MKPVGTAHSFTPIAASDGVLMRPNLLTGIRAIDRSAGTATVAAGTPLKQLNLAQAQAGLSPHEHGRHHGTDRRWRDQYRHARDRPFSASISAQIRALELVTADGGRRTADGGRRTADCSILTCSTQENPEVFAAARVGLGVLRVVSTITFAVEPLFLLTAREEPMIFDRVTGITDELVAEKEHFEFYWFPHTENCNTLRNNRSAGPIAPVG